MAQTDDENPPDEGEETPPTDDADDADDAAETEPSRESRLKRLSGPQACLAIVGCGTLAAVVVVALFVGGVRWIAGAFTSEESDTEEGSEIPERSPRASTEPGVLNVCRIGIESSGVLSNLERIDSEVEPVDTATLTPPNPDGRRTVEDECLWTLSSTEGSQWEMSFDYMAIMNIDGGDDKTRIASSEFTQWVEASSESFATVEFDGRFEGAPTDDAYFYFGASADDEELSRCILIGRTKSAVFTLQLQDAAGEPAGAATSEAEFRRAIGDVLPYIHSDFEHMVPD